MGNCAAGEKKEQQANADPTTPSEGGSKRNKTINNDLNKTKNKMNKEVKLLLLGKEKKKLIFTTQSKEIKGTLPELIFIFYYCYYFWKTFRRRGKW